MDAITQLSFLRSERAVYEMRIDLAEAGGRPSSSLVGLNTRLALVNKEIERREREVEKFKAEALAAYGVADPVEELTKSAASERK